MMEVMDVDQHAPKAEKAKSAFDKLPYEVQEEIEGLYEFVPEVAEQFEVFDKIGEGTFSSVFLARLKHHPEIQQLFALKHIIPTSHPSRIEGELRCLLEIGGQDNVMGVELCLRHRDHVVIVMEYVPHEKFQDYMLQMGIWDVQDYMKNLLIALARVHQFDIIHRDVKPSNFLYDKNTSRYSLVDFGLAHKAPVCKASENQCSGAGVGTGARRGVLTPTQDNSNRRISNSEELKKKDTNSSVKSKHYTPPAPDMSNSVFTKRIKSPRRMLLAKRALLVKEKQDASRRKSGQGSSQSTACNCFGKPQICSLCSARSNQVAPRAGTPGFRSPEVLMKCPDQSTAVDIWSAGVIFLSLLSGRYPFFRANDDMTALAQIISTLGSDQVKEAALACGKQLICNPAQQSLDFKTLCTKLRTAPVSKMQTSKRYKKISRKAELSWRHVPDSAYDLLAKLVDLDPYKRITAEEALHHSFFTEKLNK